VSGILKRTAQHPMSPREFLGSAGLVTAHIGASLGNVHEEGSVVGSRVKESAAGNRVFVLEIGFVETSAGEGIVHVPEVESGSADARLAAAVAEHVAERRIERSPYLAPPFLPFGSLPCHVRVLVGFAFL